MQVQTKSRFPSVIYLTFSCLIFAAFYIILKSHLATQGYASGMFSVVLEAVQFAAMAYSFSLWRKAPAESKRIFGYFALSFLCVFVTDFIYLIIFNILHLSHVSLSIFTLSLINIPYLGFLIFQLLAWINILPRMAYSTKKLQDLPLYIPVAIIVIAMFFLFFMIYKLGVWHNQFSLSGFYNSVEAILGFAVFVTAMLCLATSKHKGIFYLSLGFLIGKTGGLIMMFGIFAQTYGVSSFVEILWPIGTLFMIYGLMDFKKSETYNSSPKTWTYEINSIHSQIAFWVFAISILVVSVFLAIHYMLSPKFFF